MQFIQIVIVLYAAHAANAAAEPKIDLRGLGPFANQDHLPLGLSRRSSLYEHKFLLPRTGGSEKPGGASASGSHANNPPRAKSPVRTYPKQVEKLPDGKTAVVQAKVQEGGKYKIHHQPAGGGKQHVLMGGSNTSPSRIVAPPMIGPMPPPGFVPKEKTGYNPFYPQRK